MSLERDKKALALTIFGEARGEGVPGMVAVANVILNRVRIARWGYTKGCSRDYDGKPIARGSIIAVCLHPKAFSCWNGEPGRNLWNNVSALRRNTQHWAIAVAAIHGLLRDNTGGADHYYAHAGRNGIPSPSWVSSPHLVHTADIGNHRFFGVAD